jgi:hypothetical protein
MRRLPIRGWNRRMPHYIRYCLTANIEHFTTLLQSDRLDEQQKATVRLLLAESQASLCDSAWKKDPLGGVIGVQKPDRNEDPDDIERLATRHAARWHRNRQSRSSPHLLHASWVRFIGFRYVTPHGLSTRPAEAFGRSRSK